MRFISIPALTTSVLLPFATAVHADTVQVSLNGSHVQAVTAAGVTIPAHRLATGRSFGAVTGNSGTGSGFAITAADDHDIASYFARSGSSADWIVSLNLWSDQNGATHDFFLFEVGGGDSVLVAPRFAGGVFGQEVSVSGWTATGYNVPTGPNQGQQVFGLSIRSSQLRDANGNPLTPAHTLTGLRLRSSEIDVASFLIADPAALGGPGTSGDGSVFVTGVKRATQPIEVHFRGPWASESSDSPNPFLDYRLNVRFDGPGGLTFTVPGFFNADGAGGAFGNLWTARFTPEKRGTWTATASFRRGNNVAISLANGPGSPGMLDGVSKTIEIGHRDSNAPGFWKYGRLEYVDEHYQKFQFGPYFIKGGTNSPENFMGYRGFDGVSDAGGIGIMHRYEDHVADWQSDDPVFVSDVHNVDSKGIIGALNYLSSVGVNSIFAIIMNLGGDGQDAHPFLGPESSAFNKTHYDVSRLEQWKTVFEHAAARGIMMHLGLAETETANENWLDGGNLGIERKLFYREMAARFAHIPAIKWTLCEESDYSVSELREFADYLHAQDVYGHLVTFHNHTNDYNDYDAVEGESRFTATSIQYVPDQAGNQVEGLRAQSAAAGHKWVVQFDENNPAGSGLTDNNADDLRRRVLYDVYFSGGQVEWYAGYHNLPLGGDVKMENFRTREQMWKYMTTARRFMEAFLPFWEMQPADQLVTGESSGFGGAEVFAKLGDTYAIYLPSASSGADINMAGVGGNFRQRWFNPRSGFFEGSPSVFQAAATVDLGNAPSSSSNDWIILLDRPGEDLVADTNVISVAAGGTQTFTLDAGAQHAGRAYLLMGSRSGVFPGFFPGNATVPLSFDSYTRFTIQLPNTQIHVNTSGVLDASGQATAQFVVPPGFFTTLAGTTLHHSYLLFSPMDYASEPVPLLLVP